jgi:HK97 family phage portal protein
VRNIFKRAAEWLNPIFGTIRYSTPGTYTAAKATKLSTVYRCVNLLSDSIASLPMNPYTFDGDWKKLNYKDGKFNLLNVQPNPFQSAFMFKKRLVTDMLLQGNAYVFIDRDLITGRVKGLFPINPGLITVTTTGNDIQYVYNGSATYDKSQIIHILNYTQDYVVGISTLQYAADSLGIAYASEAHAGNYFKSGGNMAGILSPKPGTRMIGTQAADAKKAMIDQLNAEAGGNTNSIIVLGDGLEYQPIAVNPKDSQLLESRQFNVNEICRFFGVPPTMAFSDATKFSTAEQQSLDFLNNALTPLMEKHESEFFRKLYLPSEWDTSELKYDAENIMRLDAASRADYYSKLYQIGSITTNEVRAKINSEFPVTGGNRAFIQVNLQPLDNLISEQTDGKTN